jgi:hypothetical protein
MVWICSSLEVSLVTLRAIRIHKLVVPVRMAGLALQSRMISCEWKLRSIVIERCRSPGCCVVTRLAVLTEVPCHMVWIHGSLEVSLVTLSTIGVYELVVAVRVAGQALNTCMISCQWKLRRIVIECCGPPACRSVAGLALIRKTRIHVVWIDGSDICLLMTRHALSGHALEHVVAVAARTRLRLVCTGQREASQVVVKPVAPGGSRDSMAHDAIS